MNYTIYKQREFIWIGRNDGLNNVDNSEKIIDVLSEKYNNRELLKILINYYKGFKIGSAEKVLKEVCNVFYSEEHASLVFENKDGSLNKVFSSDFISANNSRAVDEAIKTLSRRIK